MKELGNITMPKTGFKNEKGFTGYWLNQLSQKGFWTKKWSDGSQDKKPYDCDIVTQLGSYHCEIKYRKTDMFDTSIFRPNQIAALTKIAQLGGNAIVCIYSSKTNTYKVFWWKDIFDIEGFTNKLVV